MSDPRLVAQALLVFVVWATSCSRDSRRDTVESRDSSSAPHRPETVTATLRISGEQLGLAPFVPDRDIVAFPSGTFAVSDNADRRVWMYSPDGRQLNKIGGKGSGPGEAQVISRLMLKGDTLAVWDARQRRISLFGSDGRFVRMVILERGYQLSDGTPLEELSVLGWLPSNDLLGLAEVGTSLAFVRAPASGGRVQVIATAIRPDDVHLERLDDGTLVYLDVVPNRPVFAASSDGLLVGVARIQELRRDSAVVRLVLLGPNADTLRSHAITLRADPVPKRVGDSIVETRVRAGMPPGQAAVLRRKAYVSPVYPPVTHLIIGTDSTVWLHLRSGDTTEYLQVPIDGPWQRILIKERFTAASGTRNWLFGVAYDSDDLQSLVRFRIPVGLE